VLILEDNEHGIAAARASGAHLMVIGSTEDVRYAAIKAAIAHAEAGQPA
jgi:beta-phosphoglucomutase-like phosphatase (HAD superfamily)